MTEQEIVEVEEKEESQGGNGVEVAPVEEPTHVERVPQEKEALIRTAMAAKHCSLFYTLAGEEQIRFVAAGFPTSDRTITWLLQIFPEGLSNPIFRDLYTLFQARTRELEKASNVQDLQEENEILKKKLENFQKET